MFKTLNTGTFEEFISPKKKISAKCYTISTRFAGYQADKSYRKNLNNVIKERV